MHKKGFIFNELLAVEQVRKSSQIKCCSVSPQVILVQVNPGEAFTIRREDGQFQCITGKKVVLLLHVYVQCDSCV